MSNVFLVVLFILVSCRSHRAPNDILIEFKENGDIIETPVYREPAREQGSGFGLTPHMRLGPGNGDIVDRPLPLKPHTPPPLNDGANGVPIDLDPDDPGTPGQLAFNCTVTFINQTQSEKNKYNAACSMIETIVTTAAFEDDVKTHRSYNGSVGYFGSSTTCNSAGELGNIGASVYQHMRNGDERRPSTTAVDNEMDMKVEMYRDDASSTIGYTYSTSDQIWVNRKYSDGYKPSSIASNLFHEWLHKLSYGHSSASTSCRPYTVPYAIGYMIRDYATPLNSSYGY